MTSSELSPRFVLFVVVSLLTHLLELAASGLLCHVIMKQDDLRTPWFSLAAGLLIIPLVAVQLASAVFLLRRKGEAATGCEITATAVLHILQLGFISRHFAVLQEAPMTSKRAEVAEMLLLRLAFAFTSGCTLCLLQAYLILRGSHDTSWTWAVGLAGAITLFSITWALATYRRELPEAGLEMGLISWPGTPLKMLWRAGEVLTRLLALGLFASLYTHWVFLVLGLHWIAMLACVCIPAMTSIDWRSMSCPRRFAICLMTSFAYMFAFLNTSGENAVFRYTFFYVMLFLENTTLVAVWLVQCSSHELSRNSPFVIVAAIAFITSIIAMIIYHKFFHIALDEKTGESPAVPGANAFGPCGNTICVSCKHTNTPSSATAHPPIPPRPGAAGNWLNQYQSAVYCGQYYKHTAQDSLLDSISDLNSTITVSSTHARLQKKLATIDDDVMAQDSGSNNSRQRSSMPHQPRASAVVKEETGKAKSPKNKWRKRSPTKKRDKTAKSDSDVMSSTTDADHSEDSASQKRPVWLPSGDSTFANQLLTYSLENFDTTDTADDERSSVATGNQGFAKAGTSSASPRDIVAASRSGNNKSSHHAGAAFQTSGEHHWYSDGYSTDRTLDWPNQLHNKLWGSGALAGQHDSEPGCYNCADYLHGDTEFSSIMRSISSGEPGDSSQNSHLSHHKHPPHQQHRHRSEIKSSHRSHHQSTDCEDRPSDLLKSTAGLERIQEHQRSRAHKDQKEDFLGRSHRLPSPASDPSYGPKPKKKHSPRRKQHTTSGHSDNSTSQPSHHQSHGVKVTTPHLPQGLGSRDDNLEFKQNERLAKELLQASDKSRADSESAGTDSSTTKAADPRFTVRVMTAASGESRTSSDDRTISPGDNKKHRAPRSTARDVKDCTREQARGTHSSRHRDDSTQSKDSVPPTALSNTSETPSNPIPEPVPSKSSSTKNTSEVIYENIWQTEQVGKSKKSRSLENQTVCPTVSANVRSVHNKHRATGSVGKDAWYVCSESEDSALPPEALSSSVDGFTASDNDSDASVEIVI